MHILQVVLWLFRQGWQPPGFVYYGQALLSIHAYFVGMLLFTIYGIAVFTVLRYLRFVIYMPYMRFFCLIHLSYYVVACCLMYFDSISAVVF